MFGSGTLGGGDLSLFASWTCLMSCLWLLRGLPGLTERIGGLGPLVLTVGIRLNRLMVTSSIDAPVGEVLQAVSRVWKSGAPSKVVVFSWQLLLDRIPTKLNLSHRGVPRPVGGLGCVFCDESSVHLFLSCLSILPVWYQVSRWLGWDFVIHMGLAQ